MKRINIRVLLLLVLVSITFSCEEQLDVTPRNQLTEDLVLKDVSTAQGLLNSALAVMRNGNYYGRGFTLLPELLADNCKLVNPGDRSGRGLNESINLSGSHINIWFVYQTINSINLIIDAVDQNQITINSQAEGIAITRIKAQALFLRALYHFDLVRTYGYNPNYILNNFDLGVPISTVPVKSKSDIQLTSRAKVVEVYRQVEKDLLESIVLFTATGTPNASGNASVSARLVPTRAAAQALLSRVYLYWAGPSNTDKYPLVIQFATEAINAATTTLSTTANLVTNWTAVRESPESFLEASFAINAENLGGDNSLEGWYTRNVNAAGARVTGWGDVIASDELVAAHGGTDLRLSGLMQQARRDFEPSASRETRKYKAIAGQQFGLDNVPVIRVAEVLLNRAEAYALSSPANDAAALADLNLVRVRSGLTALVGVTGPALLTEIYNERRRELAFEGHRWFDFTRRGLDVQKPAGSVISYADFRILAPIPLSEVQANPNLIQNPGY